MASTARLDELKKKFDENPRRYFAPLANEHRKSGDLDQAIALCRTHLPQQPGHISGHIVLAQALYEAGSLDESRELFHTALGLDPENLIALRYLGDIAKDAADVETARSWYQRVLEVDPRNDEIAQMIRDLDAPPPAPAPIEAPVAEEASRFAPPAASAAPDTPAPSPAAPTNNDARFAPLSIEEIDLDETVSAHPTEGATRASEALPSATADSLDVHASWDASAASDETLDTPGVDPFALNPANSADALFAAPGESETHDFFLTELADESASSDGIETASYALDAWPEPESPEHQAAEPERSEPQAAEAAASRETAGASETFEDGSFYLEPPPAAPSDVTGSDDAVPAAEPDRQGIEASAGSAASADEPNEAFNVPAAGMDAFAAEYYAPTELDRAAPAPTTESEDWFEPAQPAPNAEATPAAEPETSVSDGATAEWEPLAPATAPTPAEPIHDALGLEVMEFVPPSSAQQPPSMVDAEMPDTDPVIGRTPQMASGEQRIAPAAFVTETMAELYLQQGFRNEALDVYRELLARNPADASLRERIEQIENGSISSVGMAMVSENVVESALKRQSARPTRSVRSFFASLASRRAPMQPPRDGADAASAPSVQAEPDALTPPTPAAETLATFDPFADTVEAESWAGLVPNETSAPVADVAAPASPAPSPRLPTPVATPAATREPTSARRSLEDLFPDTPITARTEAAAQTLATAFGRSEPQGRPTRAASNELSLDHVFRGAPEGAPPGDGGFSFDQFFSDSRASGAEASAPAASASESGRGSGSGDAHDIEQFTAWLEGLKKK